MENKQLICTRFRDVLKLTRQYHDLLDLIYVSQPNGRSYVLAVFAGGRKHVNTSGDSGTAMLKDILTQLE